MLYKALWAFPHIPGVCGDTFISPTCCFALPFAAAASCCAINLWVRSVRRLKHSLDIAVQLCGCPPRSIHIKGKCSRYVWSPQYPHIYSNSAHLLSAKSFKGSSTIPFVKSHSAFLLQQYIYTEKKMKTWTDSILLAINNSTRLQWNPLSTWETSSLVHQIWN